MQPAGPFANGQVTTDAVDCERGGVGAGLFGDAVKETAIADDACSREPERPALDGDDTPLPPVVLVEMGAVGRCADGGPVCCLLSVCTI